MEVAPIPVKMLCELLGTTVRPGRLDVLSKHLESKPHPPADREVTAVDSEDDIEDNQAPPTVAPPQDRSTDRPAHTPRGARSGDHPGRPGALPPAPGRLSAVLASGLTPAVSAVLLIVVSWQVAVSGPLLTVDHRIRAAVTHARHAADSTVLNRFGQFLSDLGDGGIAVPALLAAGVLAAWLLHRSNAHRHWWLPLPTAALTALLIPLLVVPAKVYFARPGPLGLPMVPGQWGWYPSGHTSTACIAYGTGALLLGRALRAAARRIVYAATAVLGLGVGAGLVWCDYHWFLDVLAGWCLSGLALWALARQLPSGR